MSRSPTVFVIDDDSALRKGLSLSLKQRGYTVERFSSAEEFLDGSDKDRPGCMILDVRMPHITGLELQDILMARGINIPILFISAHGNISMTALAMRKGAIDFLEKPYELDHLIKRVDEALAKDKTMRANSAEELAVRQRFERLSRREREVMGKIVAGAADMSNRVVAEQLGISHRTVETYRARLMEKMQARSLPELAMIANRYGLYDAESH